MKKSLTLIEVIVGAIILALAFGGVFAAFTGARSYATYSNERIVAANLARRALEDLYENVSADTWDTGDLRVDGAARGVPDYSIDDQTYGPANEYMVTNVAGQQYRSVQVDINYTSGAGTMGGLGGGSGEL